MKRLLKFSTLFIGGMVIVLGLALWEIHPWMRAGTPVYLGAWTLGGHTFQVWQRKNITLAEPFATGLFVRLHNGIWQAYCLDIDDLYRPNVLLKQTPDKIRVYHGGHMIGEFDPRTETFRRYNDGALFEPVNVDGDPPGTWWTLHGVG